MREIPTEKELKFINHYLETGDKAGSVRAAFPEFKNSTDFKRLYRKFNEVMSLWRVSNYITEQTKKQELLTKELIERKLFERVNDDSEKGPQIQAIKLGAEILRLKDQHVIVYPGTNEDLKEILAQSILHHADNGDDTDEQKVPGEPE